VIPRRTKLLLEQEKPWPKEQKKMQVHQVWLLFRGEMIDHQTKCG
jgi:hypothetical protein